MFLKLHEWVKGVTYLEESDVLKITKLLKNANKVEK